MTASDLALRARRRADELNDECRRCGRGESAHPVEGCDGHEPFEEVVLLRALADAVDKTDSQEECPGEGVCHGALNWCSSCGDVDEICDDFQNCDAHPPCVRCEEIASASSESGLCRRCWAQESA